MTTRARTTVTGFGAHATSAKAAPTSPQLVTIESHARLPWIASSSRRSPGDRASVHGLAGAAARPGSTPVPYVGPRGRRVAVPIDGPARNVLAAGAHGDPQWRRRRGGADGRRD